MAIIFDGSSKIITLTSGTITLGVRDLWSRWVDWFLTNDNSKFLPAMANLGGEDIDLSAGTKIPIYLFLLNGWKIRPQPANHTLLVNDGILLVSGGGDPFIDPAGSYVIRINYQQPVQAIGFSTGSGITAQDKLDIAAAVRTELNTEMNRIDTPISSRLAASNYVPPLTTSKFLALK